MAALGTPARRRWQVPAGAKSLPEHSHLIGAELITPCSVQGSKDISLVPVYAGSMKATGHPLATSALVCVAAGILTCCGTYHSVSLTGMYLGPCVPSDDACLAWDGSGPVDDSTLQPILSQPGSLTVSDLDLYYQSDGAELPTPAIDVAYTRYPGSGSDQSVTTYQLEVDPDLDNGNEFHVTFDSEAGLGRSLTAFPPPLGWDNSTGAWFAVHDVRVDRDGAVVEFGLTADEIADIAELDVGDHVLNVVPQAGIGVVLLTLVREDVGTK